VTEKEAAPAEIVATGYDAVASAYAELERPGAAWPRLEWLDALLDDLPAAAHVLDVGCGNGLPATRAIAEHCHATGVDVSAVQVERARRNVPQATFLRGDVLELDIAPASFAAIAAFYALDHVPRSRHAELLGRFHDWLEPGGLLLFCVEPDDCPDMVATWLGTPMFFSSHDAGTSRRLVAEAGFTIEREAVERQLEGGRPVDYLWILARRD
jgi:cyclopropane fatty-acyl-phospholipid synthase-like methyltransferase